VAVPKVSPPSVNRDGGSEEGKKPPAQKSTTSRARVMAKLPPPPTNGKAGPRRVLIDSAEAPQIRRAFKG